MTPKFAKPLLTSVRRATPEDEPMLEHSEQRQQRLSKQLKNDKRRTIVNRNREIKRAKGALQRAQDPSLRKQLRQRIQLLENKNKQENQFL